MSSTATLSLEMMKECKKRAARIPEIAADILKQDKKAQIVICGDFNKQLPGISKALEGLEFTPALHYPTITHKQGGHLDQIFVKNMKVIEATLSKNFIDDISDHKCLKVNLKLQERTPAVQMRNMNSIR